METREPIVVELNLQGESFPLQILNSTSEIFNLIIQEMILMEEHGLSPRKNGWE